jgi:FkbM family methyltransferase
MLNTMFGTRNLLNDGVKLLNSISIKDIAALSRQDAEAQIRARVQNVPMGNDLILTRILGHPKMFLHTSDLGFSAHVMLDGYWEIWLTQILAKLITPGMVVIDVGANFGYYSVLAASCVWPNGKVIAIEPNPPVAAVMDKTIQLNGFQNIVRLEKVAAGATDVGVCHLYVPFSEPKNASIVEAGSHFPGGETISVPMRTIDSLCRDMDRVDLVKIDAEGAETGIIQGMLETIERFKPIIALEFNAARYADAKQFLGQLTALYGNPKLIDFYGEPKAVSESEILLENVNEDKLLLFGAR